MRPLAAVVVLVAVVSGGASPGAARAGSDFEGWFLRAIDGELAIPAPVERAARSFRYVFVGGFRNERMPGYFAQNMAELRARGIPRGQIHVISPSSGKTTAENAGAIRSRFLAIAGEGPERLVVIAHSRGACDALAFALENGAFVRDRVEALFLIQGPFGGSGVAEYIVGGGTPMDRRMPWRYRALASVVGRLARFSARRSGIDALEGMTRAASREFWEKALRRHADALPLVGPKTFYVRSTTTPARLRFARRAIAWYLALYHGPSDGMVAVADQMLPALGTVIATLDAGHTDLTHHFPATRAPRRAREALIRSILMTVGQPRAVAAANEISAR